MMVMKEGASIKPQFRGYQRLHSILLGTLYVFDNGVLRLVFQSSKLEHRGQRGQTESMGTRLEVVIATDKGWDFGGTKVKRNILERDHIESHSGMESSLGHATTMRDPSALEHSSVWFSLTPNVSLSMEFLKNLGSAAATSLLAKSGITLPFSLGNKVAYFEGRSIWTLYEAVKRVC